MSVGTTRLSLTKPGGGSTGLILPADPVDIDVLNANFDKIDDAIGFKICTSATRPASPFLGQAIFETDTAQIKTWNGTVWITDNSSRGTRTIYYGSGLAAMDAITDALDGDLFVMDAPGTGITENLLWMAFSGTGVSIDWRVVTTVVADTKANLDAFITAVAAISGTDAQFTVGNFALVTASGLLYRFTSTAGAYSIQRPVRFQVERTASQTMTSAAPVLTTFWGTPVENPASHFTWNGTNGTLLCLQAGRYRIKVNIQIAAAAGTAYTIAVTKNSATFSVGVSVAASTGVASSSVQGFYNFENEVTLAANDVLRLLVVPSANIAAGDAYTGPAAGQLTVEYIGT